MIRWFRLPLAASIAGHCGAVALLLWFAGYVPPAPLPIVRGIEIILPPPQPVAPVLKAEPPPEPPPPVVETHPPPPPQPPPPVVKAEKPPPREPPPPRPQLKSKPLVRRPPPVRQPPPQPVPFREMTPAVLPPPAPVQTAVIPRPPIRPPPPPRPAGPIVSPGYGAALSAWLHSHIRYPESARERGEEGRAVLRFRIARSGQVLSSTIVQSTGHPDLDAAIEQMMRGASLPPFPSDMTAPDVEVSVPVDLRIAR